MTSDKFQIKIDSILGGHAPTTHFAMEGQFRASLGINPLLPPGDDRTIFDGSPSGLIRPVGVQNVGTTVAVPLWIVDTPKLENTVFVYDSIGSVYTLNDTLTTLTDLTDLTDGGTASGNGCAYYDNYVYFSRDTTVARYGPLNGSPVFTDDYWVTTLSKTALTNTAYPIDYDFQIKYPNHVLHRHSDGRLYIADVVGNTGSISFIQTKKTTVEGDTDDGSTYDKLNVGYGLWPTAMESYGSDLAIAFIELAKASGTNNFKTKCAKLGFWDTISTDLNSITWVEYPDQMITALKNINGVLYVVSGNQYQQGFRITRFVGGYSFQEVAKIGTGQPPFAGAVDGESNRLLFGSWTHIPTKAGCIYSYGGQLGDSIFNVASIYGIDSDSAYTNAKVVVSALKIADTTWKAINQTNPIMGVSPGEGLKNHGIWIMGDSYENAPCIWWSQEYRIGQRFKITKIRIPMLQVFSGTAGSITPKIYVDNGQSSYTMTARTTTADYTEYNMIRRSDSNSIEITGNSSFFLELRFTADWLNVASLPITIEYELLDD